MIQEHTITKTWNSPKAYRSSCTMLNERFSHFKSTEIMYSFILKCGVHVLYDLISL